MMDVWLPLFFVAAMGLALLIYVILDGYDLGIGILLPLAEEDEKDAMIAEAKTRHPEMEIVDDNQADALAILALHINQTMETT